jgi:hypothetical protein
MNKINLVLALGKARGELSDHIGSSVASKEAKYRSYSEFYTQIQKRKKKI